MEEVEHYHLDEDGNRYLEDESGEWETSEGEEDDTGDWTEDYRIVELEREVRNHNANRFRRVQDTTGA